MFLLVPSIEDVQFLAIPIGHLSLSNLFNYGSNKCISTTLKEQWPDVHNIAQAHANMHNK